MKKILFLLGAVLSGAAIAQTNRAPAVTAPTAPTEITSDSADFDLNTSKAVYRGHVFVTDPELKLQCDLLTIDFPSSDTGTNQMRRPNHVQADTNVVIDFVDEKGITYHVTSQRAVYAYKVENLVTNETVVFTGSPRAETPDLIITSEPMVWNQATRHFEFYNQHMISKPRPNGSTNNSSLMQILK